MDCCLQRFSSVLFLLGALFGTGCQATLPDYLGVESFGSGTNPQRVSSEVSLTRIFPAETFLNSCDGSGDEFDRRRCLEAREKSRATFHGRFFHIVEPEESMVFQEYDFERRVFPVIFRASRLGFSYKKHPIEYRFEVHVPDIEAAEHYKSNHRIRAEWLVEVVPLERGPDFFVWLRAPRNGWGGEGVGVKVHDFQIHDQTQGARFWRRHERLHESMPYLRVGETQIDGPCYAPTTPTRTGSAYGRGAGIGGLGRYSPEIEKAKEERELKTQELNKKMRLLAPCLLELGETMHGKGTLSIVQAPGAKTPQIHFSPPYNREQARACIQKRVGSVRTEFSYWDMCLSKGFQSMDGPSDEQEYGYGFGLMNHKRPPCPKELVEKSRAERARLKSKHESSACTIVYPFEVVVP